MSRDKNTPLFANSGVKLLLGVVTIVTSVTALVTDLDEPSAGEHVLGNTGTMPVQVTGARNMPAAIEVSRFVIDCEAARCYHVSHIGNLWIGQVLFCLELIGATQAYVVAIGKWAVGLNGGSSSLAHSESSCGSKRTTIYIRVFI